MSAHTVLSFAMQNHGSAFAHWLRSELMRHLSLFDIDAVYLDCVVSRNVPGAVTVAVDDREHMRSPTGARPIGAQRANWKSLYDSAMAEAQYMVFCYTPEYRNSRWCMLEWDEFLAENQRRGKDGRNALQGVVLNFTQGRPALPSLSSSNAQIISVDKVDGQRRGLTWDQGDYRMSQADLNELFGRLKGLPQ